jgi:hypothetical protein
MAEGDRFGGGRPADVAEQEGMQIAATDTDGSHFQEDLTRAGFSVGDFLDANVTGAIDK